MKKAMRMVIALCVLASLAGCTDGEWRAGEWNDMENMCREAENCDAPCESGDASARSGCTAAP